MMSTNEMKDKKQMLCNRLGELAAKSICFFRMIRCRRLQRRIEYLERVGIVLSE